MSINFTHNYFELFDLPEKFRLDRANMTETWLNIQDKIHPDRHVSASNQEKRLSMQWVTYVNEAYVTLRNPLNRARYLLSLHGFDTKEETDTHMPMDFLIEQMSWREDVEDACLSRNINALEELHNKILEITEIGENRLGELIDDDQDYSGAVIEVRKLRFLQRLSQEITQSIERLEQ